MGVLKSNVNSTQQARNAKENQINFSEGTLTVEAFPKVTEVRKAPIMGIIAGPAQASSRVSP